MIFSVWRFLRKENQGKKKDAVRSTHVCRLQTIIHESNSIFTSGVIQSRVKIVGIAS